MSHEGFLHDILENPEDDAPRLVYADWLTDHGDETRAEFIRLQCELARLDRYDPRRPGLERREGELLAAHGFRWLQDAGLEDLEEPRWQRGFVEHAAFEDCGHYLDRARRLPRRTPLCSVRFGDLGDWDAEYQRCKGLDRLLRSKAGQGLRRIEARVDALEWRDLVILDALPAGTLLEELDLAENDLGDLDLEGLSRCRGMAQLRVLGLGDNSYGLIGLRCLAESPDLVELRELDLQSASEQGHPQPEATLALTSSPHLTGLRALSLAHHRLGGAGLRCLTRWPGLERLVRLNLSHNSGRASESPAQDAIGLGELLESPHWNELRELDVSGATIPDLRSLDSFVPSVV
jgi:uncharacterized protein (TIGR02996 family)